ncbi:MAG TPA: hypothetical protein PLU95_04095 [Syntrophales bacterium]|nr:hypothetical protein [Syntrophales bacterium]HPN08460.1 hypothetical protein [Syntrophales bacterium]HPX80575.1 hypothetical protein [Syntrophales bacterium]
MGFRDCFSRTAAFEWFVIVVAGFLFRLDHHGVSSIIRWLALDSDLYTALISFFRASSWRMQRVMDRWFQIVLSEAPLIQINDRCILIGDGIKISKVRFVLVKDGNERFILLTSDLTLSPQDIITAYSHRFKIEVTFKVMKHLLGVFFYHFWTSGWPKIGKNNQSVISSLIPDHKRLIVQATNAIEGFVNFGCIATGTLQILALKHHEKIWQSYRRWLRTYTSYIPSDEVVRSVIQEEFLHNFRSFRNSAIYRIIMSKSRKNQQHQLPMVA